MLKRIQKEQQKENGEAPEKPQWSRTLILGSRGISAKQRYLMQDFMAMLPHHKTEPKYDNKHNFSGIAEICEMRNCDSCIFFENRKHTDLYLWFCKAPHGPSIKFYVGQIITMTDLKLTGNALKGSRPILSFGKEFDETNDRRLMKQVISDIFNVQQNYPKSKPFIDHVLQFSLVDDHVWFRNYQIVDGDGNDKLSLVEIGPRFYMQCIKILEGCFSGNVVYLNEKYVSPNVVRADERREAQLEAKRKSKKVKESKAARRELKEEKTTLDKVFDHQFEMSDDDSDEE